MIPLRNIGRYIGKVIRQPTYALDVAYRRMRAYAAYRSSAGTAPMPEGVTLYLTHQCNLRCKMCGQWGEMGAYKTMPTDAVCKKMSRDELMRLSDELARWKPSVTLFGGEPLMHPDCVELVAALHARGMHTLMITNGSLLETKAGALAEAGLDELNISIDGYGAVHDDIRGMPGLFEKITRGVAAVQAIKKEKHLKRPLINLQCTMMKDNYTRLSGAIQTAFEWGADSVTFHNLIFLAPELITRQDAVNKELSCTSDDWKGFVADPGIDVEKLIEQMRAIKKGTYPFAIDFYPNLSEKGLREYYRNPAYKPSEYKGRCVSPWICAYVFDDGSVRPCLNSSYAFGYVQEDGGFSAAWNSDRSARFRRMLKQRALFPACVRCTELYRY